MAETREAGAPMDRRGFLKLALRALALAGLAYLGLKSLGLRGSGRAQGGDICGGDGLCPRCPGLGGCAPPQARLSCLVHRPRPLHLSPEVRRSRPSVRARRAEPVPGHDVLTTTMAA